LAILSILGLWFCGGIELDEGVAEVVLNSETIPTISPTIRLLRVVHAQIVSVACPVRTCVDVPFRCFVFLSKVTRSGLLRASRRPVHRSLSDLMLLFLGVERRRIGSFSWLEFEG